MTSALVVAAVVLVYACALALHARLPAIVTMPVVVAPALIAVVVAVRHVDAARFGALTAPLNWMLGPATTAFALPIYLQRDRIRRLARPIIFGVASGAMTSIAIVVASSRWLGLSRSMRASLLPKSVTTPIALPLCERLGGVPALTVAAVLVSGTIAMIAGPELLTKMRVVDPAARGLAIGTAAHGFGTARALREGELTGAMSGVAMILAGVVTAIVLSAWNGR